MNHRNIYPGLTGFRQGFIIVFAQPPAPAQPGQGSFHYPAPGQNRKPVTVPGTLHNLQDPTGEGRRPVRQLPPAAAVRPDETPAGKPSRQFADNRLGPVPVLNAGSMDCHGQQQPHGVYNDMPLSSGDFLAGVIAPRPPFSVVFTLWLSMIAAPGPGSLPSAARTLGRRASWTCSQTPSCRQRRKRRHTVPQGGGSHGAAFARSSRCAEHTGCRWSLPASPRCADVPGFGGRQQRDQLFPLGIGQVAGIRFSRHASRVPQIPHFHTPSKSP